MVALLRLVNQGIRSVSIARQVSISSGLSLLSLKNNISRFNNNFFFFERPLSYFSDSDAENAKPCKAYHFTRYRDYVLDSARFAVNFHNQKQNAQLQFAEVLKASRSRVAGAGSLLYITLEVYDDAARKSSFYRTRVHYWPWEKKRQVDAWECVETPSFDEEDDDDDESYPPRKMNSPFSYFSDTEADESIPMEVDYYYESDVLDCARLAVNFHNHKQNARLRFVRVLKANTLKYELKKDVLLLYILLEVNDAGKLDLYRTRIYYRPRMKKRRIQAWERVEIPSFDLEEDDDDENNSCYEKYVLKGVPFDLDRHNRKQAAKYAKIILPS